MLRYNEHTRTLQRAEHNFVLQNMDYPEYFDDVFPDGEVPQIPFNHRHVPMRPAQETWITDTTFRDGQQAMPPFTADQ
ncbi:MAG: 2-isopropylmalate synthase, partial [Planctomycetes bacterium]|nr:2-isopropylmalate synthase [Planctomycetota bacterium]